MAEEFQGEVCGGSWWSSPRTTTFIGSSYMSNYGGCLQSDVINMKTRSTDESSDDCTTTISPDSAFQMMGSSPPSTTTNWNQALLVNGRTLESNYSQTLPEIMNNLLPGGQDSSNYGMEHQQPSNFLTNSGNNSNGNLNGTSYGYPSSLLQTLLTSTSPPPSQPAAPPQQPFYDFQANLNDFNSVSSIPRFSSSIKPKAPGGLHLANKTPFWNASTLDLNHNRAGFFNSTQSPFLSSTYEDKPSYHNSKLHNEEIRDLGSSVKKSSGEPTVKRPRLETPSPLPTFKVRKEKLGDRVTALQQLVSPFGKTDTASVLHEAIEYIKLLHDQVNVLSAPYMKNGATMQRQQIQDKVKDITQEAKQQDLRSLGLCLVPVSSTFPVTTDSAPDYWTSSLGTAFR